MASQRLQSLTSEDIRRIGKTYGWNLSGEVGTTPNKALFLLAFIVVLALCFREIAGSLFGPVSGALGFVGLLLIIGGLGEFRLFFVNVPKATALITTGIFGGIIHVFPTGLHIRYPWDRYGDGDLINMRTDTIKQTTAFVTKDGITVSYDWSLSFGPYLRLLGLFVRTEPATLENGLSEVALGTLAKLILGKTVEEMRQPETTSKIRDAIDGNVRENTDEMGNTSEERFGLTIEQATLGPPKFSEDYEQGVAARVLRTIIQEDAKRMADELNISPNDALNAVMMLNKEEVKKSVMEVAAGKDVIDVLKNLGIGVGKVADKVAKGLQAAGDNSAPSPNVGTNVPKDNEQ